MSWARIVVIPRRWVGRAFQPAVFAALLFPLCLYGQPTQQPTPRQIFEEARQAQNQGNAALAVQKYRQLLKTHPNMVAAQANMAAALVSLGRLKEAITAYQSALKELPDNPALRLGLAIAYYRKGDYKKAGPRLASLNWEDPTNARVATLLANCDLQLGRNKQVIAILKPLEKKNADDMDLEWALGNALLRVGQPKEGLKRIQIVADKTHSVEAYQTAANYYLGLTYFDKAKRDAEAVVRLNPHVSQAYVVLGMVDNYSGDEKGAAEEFEKALQVDPSNLQARIQLGSVFYTQRKLNEAAQQLNRVLKQDPHSDAAHLLLGRVERAKGNLQGAVKELKSAEKENPQWLAPHVELAALYYLLKQPAEGAKEQKIVKQLMSQERQRKAATRVIMPTVPAPR